ncbi:MAG TPA: hypothetical protein VGQ99_12065 [Tepidisphaeraceae bacterium]|jgi:hypothetical protein|nr:hypothetical protein [Tepidisphaeraceae bacterium]
MFKLCAFVLPLLLCGCITQSNGTYVRTDGRGDLAQLQLAETRCRGEAVAGVEDYVIAPGAVPFLVGSVTRSAKEGTLIRACMARNGYLPTQ